MKWLIGTCELSNVSAQIQGGDITVNSFKTAEEVAAEKSMGVNETEIAVESEREKTEILNLLGNITAINYEQLESNLGINDED